MDPALDTATRERTVAIADDLARNDFAAAKDHLADLLATSPPPELVAKLKSDVIVGELLEKSVACLSANNRRGALRCLRKALACATLPTRHLGTIAEPGDSPERLFGWAATAGGRQRRQRGHWRTFLAGDALACQKACDTTARIFKASWLVSHILRHTAESSSPSLTAGLSSISNVASRDRRR